MKNKWIMIATEDSEFDVGSIVQKVDQLESDSYFRAVGLINGKPVIVDRCFPDSLDYHEIKGLVRK